MSWCYPVDFKSNQSALVQGWMSMKILLDTFFFKPLEHLFVSCFFKKKKKVFKMACVSEVKFQIHLRTLYMYFNNIKTERF